MTIVRKLTGEYLPQFVYGGIDGTVTTFAVVSAAAGAGYSAGVILVLGFANLVADGISMGVSAYLSDRSEVDQFHKHRRSVIQLLENNIGKARVLLRKQLQKYGLKAALLEDATDTMLKDKEKAAEFILKEEHEMQESSQNPRMIAFMTFLAFVLVGIVPLAIYLFDFILEFDFDQNSLFVLASILSGLAFAAIGFLKSRVTQSNRVVAVAETLLLGGVAAASSYVIGYWLARVFHVS